MIKDLIRVAKKLDEVGLVKEADFIDGMIRKLSNESMNNPFGSSPGLSSGSDMREITTGPDEIELIASLRNANNQLNIFSAKNSSRNISLEINEAKKCINNVIESVLDMSADRHMNMNKNKLNKMR